MNNVQNLKTSNTLSLVNLPTGTSKSGKEQDFFSIIQAIHESDGFQDTKISQDYGKKNSDTLQETENGDDKSYLYISQLMTPQDVDLASKSSMELILGSNENEANQLRLQEPLMENEKSFLYSSELISPQDIDIASKSSTEFILGSNEKESKHLRSQEAIKENEESFLYSSQLISPQDIDLASKSSTELIVGSNETESNQLSTQELLMENEKSFLYSSELISPQDIDIASKSSTELILGSNENELKHLRSQEAIKANEKSFLYSSKLMSQDTNKDIISNNELFRVNNESELNHLISQKFLKNSDKVNDYLSIVTNSRNNNQQITQKQLVNFTEITEKKITDDLKNDKAFSIKKENASAELLTGTAIKQEILFNGGTQENVRVSEIPTKINTIIKEHVADKNPQIIELKLDPEHLGELKVIINWHNGKLSAQFHTQTDEAAKTLKNEMEILKQNLTNMNIDVEGLNVSVFGQASGGFGTKSQQMPQYKRHKVKENYLDSVESLEQKQANSYLGNASVNFLV